MSKFERAAPRQEWQEDAIRTVDDRLMADLVSDFRRPVSQSASMIPDAARTPELPSPGSGWVDPAPMKAPPGVNVIDRLCDEQDRIDRAAAIRQRVEADWIEHLMEKPSRVAKDYNPFSKEWLEK